MSYDKAMVLLIEAGYDNPREDLDPVVRKLRETNGDVEAAIQVFIDLDWDEDELDEARDALHEAVRLHEAKEAAREPLEKLMSECLDSFNESPERAIKNTIRYLQKHPHVLNKIKLED